MRARPARVSERCMRVSPRAGTAAVLAALVLGPIPGRAADPAPAGLPAPLPPSDDAGADEEAAAGTLRPDLDLLANRVHALVHRDGRLLVSAADPSFLKFVDG